MFVCVVCVCVCVCKHPHPEARFQCTIFAQCKLPQRALSLDAKPRKMRPRLLVAAHVTGLCFTWGSTTCTKEMLTDHKLEFAKGLLACVISPILFSCSFTATFPHRYTGHYGDLQHVTSGLAGSTWGGAAPPPGAGVHNYNRSLSRTSQSSLGHIYESPDFLTSGGGGGGGCGAGAPPREII